MRKSDFDSRLKVLTEEPPASAEGIAALRKRFPSVPDEYVELVGDAAELELDFLGKYLRIWRPSGCIDMDGGYGISARMPGAIPIGDDGGGRVLFYFDGNNGPGLYRVGYGDLDPEDAAWVSASLTDLLCNGRGMENL